MVAQPALAATKFTSPSYSVDSVIFGGTGVLQISSLNVPPIITSGPTVTDIKTDSVVVNWETDKPSSSVVEFGTASGVEDQQAGQLTSPTFTTHTVTLNTLKKGTIYFYKVYSADVYGNVMLSVEHTFTTDPGDVNPPKIVAGPVVTINTSSSVTITWETDELANTLVDYGLTNVTESSTGHLEDLTLLHTVQLSNLLPSHTYSMRIQSQDASANTYTGPIQIIQMPNVATITDVKVSDITLNSALVEWKTTIPTTTKVQYGKTQSYGSVSDDTSSHSQNHLVRLSGLDNGTSYYLRLGGQDESGSDVTSDEYLFKTVILPVISDFKTSEVNSSTATLTWTSSSDIDQLIRTEVTKSDDPGQVGHKSTAGDDKLTSAHTFQLTDLNSGTSYCASVSGKDVFGNQAVSPQICFTTTPDVIPPDIQDIKTDTSVDLGAKQTVQVLVSFGLSELGTSAIEYGEGATGPYATTLPDDGQISRSKFMVIPGLKPGQSYHFRINAKDRSGNVAHSSDYLVLAPSRPVSLFDLIFGQVQQNFGWLNKL